jgi:hypothetical protein
MLTRWVGNSGVSGSQLWQAWSLRALAWLSLHQHPPPPPPPHTPTHSQESFHVDEYEAAGGRLTPPEAAALKRWRAATAAATATAAAQQGQQAAAEPWVTATHLEEAGLLEDPHTLNVRGLPRGECSWC